jgi:hypothetical protein
MAWAKYSVYVSGIGLVYSSAELIECVGAYYTSVNKYPTQSVMVYELANHTMIMTHNPAGTK